MEVRGCVRHVARGETEGPCGPAPRHGGALRAAAAAGCREEGAQDTGVSKHTSINSSLAGAARRRLAICADEGTNMLDASGGTGVAALTRACCCDRALECAAAAAYVEVSQERKPGRARRRSSRAAGMRRRAAGSCSRRGAPDSAAGVGGEAAAPDRGEVAQHPFVPVGAPAR